ncbi:pyrE [Acrasis kona]|uniref:PyrE n=1 Tax=Acrasis kona TaxID=1008807 RepID=A0AAW2YIR2_9EUKA
MITKLNLFIALSFFLLVFQYVVADITELVIDQTLFQEAIMPGETKIYVVHNLIPGKRYEARVSYPAIMPAYFTVETSKDLQALKQKFIGRKLLNIEKDMFTADDNRMYVLVHAEREGKTSDTTVQKKPIGYNIVVETLILGGGVPITAIPLILLVLFVVAVSASITYTIVQKQKQRRLE